MRSSGYAKNGNFIEIVMKQWHNNDKDERFLQIIILIRVHYGDILPRM